MSTSARIVHQIDGRLRLEIPEHRDDPAYFAHLAAELQQSGHVRQARFNPAAASISIEFASPRADVMADLARAGVALPAQAAPAPADTSRGNVQGLPGAGRMAADPMVLAGLLFATVGLIQTARGEIMLPALSAFWYAAGALRLARDANPALATAPNASFFPLSPFT